ncbi:MAG: adenylate/guanylate cyclase domain-containing protein, partial [Armatimonadetes bacterium]|nr:adenylate/guanylate cyclase domain-containing protein [Armatimonadota bacterium]
VNQLILKDKISLGGEEKEVSILFSDIRGYTNLSESISPEKVMQMLNEYHGEMNKIFQVNSGRVFDYQGDAQMVVFGAPLESKEHAYLAVKTALEMQKAMHELRKKWSLKEHQIEIGVGISTGIAAIGLVGDEKHKQYVALGDSTNIASRLQSLSKELNSPVLIAESTYLKIKSLISAVELPEVLLKGKSQSLKVYKAVRLNREV